MVSTATQTHAFRGFLAVLDIIGDVPGVISSANELVTAKKPRFKFITQKISLHKFAYFGVKGMQFLT